MKFKKHILKLSILAGVLACVIVAGSLFALANTNEATTPTNDNELNLTIVTTPLDEQNNTFTVTAKIANSDSFVTAKKIAGLEVTLTYDSSQITTDYEKVQYGTSLADSTVKHKVENDTVKFVCIKNSFSTKDGGYTALGNLFTVTFTVNEGETVTNPALLFNSNSVELLIGDVNATEVTARKVYAGDLEALALAILDKGLELVADANVGSMIVVAPTPKADSTEAGSEVINGNNVKYVTGSAITVGEESAQIVVKGDLDGDGLVSVFDALMIKELAEETPNDALKECAGDLGTENDAQQAIDYIVGIEQQITK